MLQLNGSSDVSWPRWRGYVIKWWHDQRRQEDVDQAYRVEEPDAGTLKYFQFTAYATTLLPHRSPQRLCAPDFGQLKNTLAPDAVFKVSFYVLKKWPGLSPPMALMHAAANNALTTPRCVLHWRALAFPGGLRHHSSIYCCCRRTVSWAALSGRIIVLCQIWSPSGQRMLIQGLFFLLCTIYPAAGFLIPVASVLCSEQQAVNFLLLQRAAPILRVLLRWWFLMFASFMGKDYTRITNISWPNSFSTIIWESWYSTSVRVL